MKIRVTKEFRFDMGHALHGYDGLCKNIHGHSYHLFVTVIGEPITDISNKKLGMVIDFGDLKEIVNREIVDKFDHSLVLNESQKEEIIKVEGSALFERYYLLPYQPTCENMIADFASRIKKHLPEDVKLFSLKMYETPTSYSEWYASDNS
ncbi:6-pyruvoyltetrahydropterin/6-carboxytetrahydropterin synthase [Balneicella halophila]|uniref:6-carboxy-5,6,7,8-tetrahydropterin synthase n=1 Tax=Balneicella halophila TaxID=1537566 RepID=A0A7L4UT12_BALHA|nr:6-carboxytetrahydropterin synthase [Balneicella halophila]PVX52174.1 6-pyruvoyltetrahydropterin/6-carboxytetrahydropterin synthase [Balneicella halophila]